MLYLVYHYNHRNRDIALWPHNQRGLNPGVCICLFFPPGTLDLCHSPAPSMFRSLGDTKLLPGVSEWYVCPVMDW